jgi:predicted dehydrogenase
MGLAQAMAEQVRDSGVKSQVGFMVRHGEAVQWLHDHIQAHDLADRGLMIGQYYCNALHAPWWRDRSRSGGQLVEQLIHTVDLARLYLGEPVRAYSIQEDLFHRQMADYTVEDASATVVRFARGGIAALIGSNGAIPGKWISQVRVILPGLTADFDGPNHGVFQHTAAGSPSTVTVDSQRNVFLAEALDLIGAIREDRPTAVPIEEGVRSLRLALAAAESARRDTPVDIPTP